jgi:hypothetical protein
MSHKNKKYAHAVIHHEFPQMKTKSESKVAATAPSRLQSVVSSIKNHSTLIAGLGVLGAAATFMFGTEKGRNLTNRATDYAVDRGKQALTLLDGVFSSPPSDDEVLEQMEFDDKIHKLQDKFRLAS